MTTDSFHIKIDADIQPLIPKFFQNLKADILLLRKAVAEESTEVLVELGHKSKGAAGSYGFHPLREIFNKIELSGENGDFPLVLKFLDEATVYIDNVKIEYISLDDG